MSGFGLCSFEFVCKKDGQVLNDERKFFKTELTESAMLKPNLEEQKADLNEINREEFSQLADEKAVYNRAEVEEFINLPVTDEVVVSKNDIQKVKQMNIGGLDDLFGNNSKKSTKTKTNKKKNNDLQEVEPVKAQEEEWPQFIPTDIVYTLRKVHSEALLAQVGAPSDLHGIQEDRYSEEFDVINSNDEDRQDGTFENQYDRSVMQVENKFDKFDYAENIDSPKIIKKKPVEDLWDAKPSSHTYKDSSPARTEVDKETRKSKQVSSSRHNNASNTDRGSNAVRVRSIARSTRSQVSNKPRNNSKPPLNLDNKMQLASVNKLPKAPKELPPVSDKQSEFSDSSWIAQVQKYKGLNAYDQNAPIKGRKTPLTAASKAKQRLLQSMQREKPNLPSGNEASVLFESYQTQKISQMKKQVQARQLQDYLPAQGHAHGLENSFIFSEYHKTREGNNEKSINESQMSLNKPGIKNNNYLQAVDNYLHSESEITGKNVFKRGSQQLRKGLIDVQGVISVINKNELDEDSSIEAATISEVDDEKHQWKKALDQMRKNPALLMEAVPTIWDEQLKQAPSQKTIMNANSKISSGSNFKQTMKKPQKYIPPSMIPVDFELLGNDIPQPREEQAKPEVRKPHNANANMWTKFAQQNSTYHQVKKKRKSSQSRDRSLQKSVISETSRDSRF